MPLRKCRFGVGENGPWDSCPRVMTNDEINELPRAQCRVPIETISTEDQADDAVNEILSSGIRVLGFDTETLPTFKKGGRRRPPAVVQFASKRKVWLFHMFAIADDIECHDIFWANYGQVYMILTPLLCNERILKVGMAVSNDMTQMQEHCIDSLQGFRDIGRIAEALGFSKPGLRSMAASMLGLNVVKDEARISNWENYPLTEAQIEYAAVDAVMSRMVYCRLEPLRRLYRIEEDGDCDF